MIPEPEALLKALGRSPIPAENTEQTAARRARVLQHLEHVERQLAERTRARGRRRRVIGVGLAFACGAAAALGLPRLRSMMEPASDVPLELVSGQIETASQGLRPSDGGFRVTSGQRLRASSSLARVDVDRNARLELATATELSFSGVAGQRVVELHRGSVHLSVEHLGAGGSLSVRTVDATVTVHGTRFSVTTLQPNARECTTVALEQGVVSVDSNGRHALLTAPSTWSSCPAPPKPAQRATPTPDAHAEEARPLPTSRNARPAYAPEDHARRGGAGRPAPELPHKPAASSTLAEENQLLASARRATLAGDDIGAVSHLERLLQLYPRSTLAQNASVERFRALARLGREADARRSAMRYLSQYPDGFAGDEARALVSRAP